jgi:predicted nucleic acid-binding protein
MKRRILLDTGPLVALLDRRDAYHPWGKSQWASLEPPVLTCDAVLSEACFLLRACASGGEAVMELLRRGVVVVVFRLEDHLEPVAKLMGKYAAAPMSLADACLVRMSELYDDSVVLTLDRHFHMYRRHGRLVVPVIMPDER